MPTKFLDPFLRVDPFLCDAGVGDSLRNIVFSIAHAGKYVAHAIRNEHLGYTDSDNFSGEKQRTLDVVADQIFCEHLRSSHLVSKFASEEQEGDVKIACDSKERYSVAFDPLDGSSLVDADFAIGSIFGIFPGDDFIGKKGKDIVAAGYIIYGPRTLFMVATRQGIWEFTENSIGEFVLSRKNIALSPEAKYFAPGNMRAIKQRPEYRDLIVDWSERGLTMRYSGGMVPDIHMMLAKGSGIFAYPSHSDYPNGKLRLLYECAPFAFLIHMAGGTAKDERGNDILEKEILTLHQRSAILVGSRNEVNHAVKMLQK